MPDVQAVVAVTYSNWIEDPSKRMMRNMANKGKTPVEYEMDVFTLIQMAPMGEEIAYKFYELMELMLEKNIAYGNAAFEPLNLFSDATAEEQLYMAVDNKLNRIKRGREYGNEDTLVDLANYLVLLLIVRDLNNR